MCVLFAGKRGIAANHVKKKTGRFTSWLAKKNK